MAETERLTEYKSRRTPARTPEPSGTGAASDSRNLFVVQRHDASTVHYDFRIAVRGVLASWSVPKGPSVNPQDKRLSVRTEDHPLDYAEFEGHIPEGEYGAGKVIVWDTGTYANLSDRPIADGLEDGHIKVELQGHKLTGAFALTRTRMRDSRENWLLVKLKDSGADRRRNPTSTQPESVLTGRHTRDVEQ